MTKRMNNVETYHPKTASKNMKYFSLISLLTVPFISTFLSIHFTPCLWSPCLPDNVALLIAVVQFIEWILLTPHSDSAQINYYVCFFNLNTHQKSLRLRFYCIQFDTFEAVLMIIRKAVKSYLRLSIMSQWTLVAKFLYFLIVFFHRWIVFSTFFTEIKLKYFTMSTSKKKFNSLCLGMETSFHRVSTIFIIRMKYRTKS